MAAERVSPPVSRAVAGFIFVVFWAIAIVSWCLVNLATEPGPRGMIADIGIIFMCAGTAGIFVSRRSSYVVILVLSLVAAGLFLLGDLNQWHILVYFLRIAGPALAFVILPIAKLTSGVRVLS